MRTRLEAQHSNAIMSLRERDKFGRITWEKLSESVRFAHIASVTRPQDTWSDFFWEDQRSQKVDWDAKQAMQRNLSLQF